MRGFRIAVAVGVVAIVGLPACAGGSTNQTSNGLIQVLNLPSEAPNTVGGLVNYNPYSPNSLTSTWLYEPLLVRNGLSCVVTPWLATGYTWQGADNLTLPIRDGVKWSDGQSFTAKDVAFTLNLGKQYPSVDNAGLWNDTFGAHADAVTVEGNSVKIKFSGNASPKFDSIISTKILPEHVYSKVGDPAKYIDKTPVNTGPFKVASYNGRRLVLERRPDYWQADKIKVKQLVLEGQYDASQAALKLRSGQLDVYWGEIPNPERTFVASNPKLNHFYYAPNGTTVLTFNLTQRPFNDVKFREATAYALNRPEMSDKATYGIMKPGSQSGLKLPPALKFLPSKYTPEGTVIPYDPAKAEQLLDAAGYRKGPGGLRTNKNGSPLNLVFQVQSGFIDYQSIVEVIVRDFNAVGLNTKSLSTAPDSVDSLKKSGDFQMLLEYLHGGCEFAKGIGSKLASNQIPTKTDVLPNVERWSDPATDATIADLAAATDEATVKADVGKLVDTMMTQFPVTSLIYAPARIIYRTDKATGWPSQEDPYAQPADDRLLILTHLKPLS
ncbi:MAG: ABC transporter substrate-binding protein [Candidatus Dormibacteraeota bacterium]|nr:ABC transporter substrate-binding protein [Candidatus Dormibacteraeota bacterium]